MGLFIEGCGWDFVYSVCTLGGIEQDLGFYDPARSFPGSSQAPLLTDGSAETRSCACIQKGVFFNIFFFAVANVSIDEVLSHFLSIRRRPCTLAGGDVWTQLLALAGSCPCNAAMGWGGNWQPRWSGWEEC